MFSALTSPKVWTVDTDGYRFGNAVVKIQNAHSMQSLSQINSPN